MTTPEPNPRTESLGLEYGTIRLVDHDPRWSEAFVVERASLVACLDGLGCRIEHVGSTAVAGLRTKPILDIAVGLPESGDLDACIERLQRLGYDYRGDAGQDGGHVFVRPKGRVRTHHVHVVPFDGPQWRNYLALRDLLRGDPRARTEYAEAKDRLALVFADDRKAYQDGKTAVVEALLRRARSRR